MGINQQAGYEAFKDQLLRDEEKLLELLQSLYVRAHFLSRYMPGVFNSGISAEDVVSDVMAEFIGSPGLLGWDPGKARTTEPSDLQASLLRFLNGALHRRMIDQIRRARFGSWLFPVSIDSPSFVESPVTTGSAADAVTSRELIGLLKRELSGDRELERFLDAALEINDSRRIDQQLAHILGRSPTHVVYLRKQFRRKLLGKRGWWSDMMNSVRRKRFEDVPASWSHR